MLVKIPLGSPRPLGHMETVALHRNQFLRHESEPDVLVSRSSSLVRDKVTGSPRNDRGRRWSNKVVRRSINWPKCLSFSPLSRADRLSIQQGKVVAS